MKINELHESTTSGAIATVAAPMNGGDTIKRGTGVYPDKKGGNLLTGKKTNKKYANSVNEDAKKITSKQQCIDYFVKRGKTAAQGAAAWDRGFRGPKPKDNTKKSSVPANAWWKDKDEITEAKVEAPNGATVELDPDKYYVWAWDGCVVVYGKYDDFDTARRNKYDIEERAVMRVGPYMEGKFRVASGSDLLSRYVSEARLEEDDLILIPGEGHRLKSGLMPNGSDRVDHEVQMARGDLFQTIKNSESILKLIHGRSEEAGLEGWVQAKITKASDYLNSVRQYLESKGIRETGGVIAGGGVGESNDSTRSKPNIIRTWSGDLYEVPAGQEDEMDDYRKAVAVIKRNRISRVSDDEYNHAHDIMMKYEEGNTGWKFLDGGIKEDSNGIIAKRITVKKWGGNDANSYAVLVDGKPAVTGLSKREVPHYKNMIMKKLQEKPGLTGTNIEEGLKDVVKKGVKSVKRGMQGWGGGTGINIDTVKDDTGTLSPETEKWVSQRKDITPHSPADLQQKLVKRKMKQTSKGN